MRVDHRIYENVFQNMFQDIRRLPPIYNKKDSLLIKTPPPRIHHNKWHNTIGNVSVNEDNHSLVEILGTEFVLVHCANNPSMLEDYVCSQV